VLSLVGRLFIVLGGAYMLRAMTDAGTIPPAAGVALGLAYGLVWLGLSDRRGAWDIGPVPSSTGWAPRWSRFPVVLEATTPDSKSFPERPVPWRSLS